MNPVILFRDGNDYPGEMDIAAKSFKIITKRTQVLSQDLVIGRYSVIPYYEDLEADIIAMGGCLINSYKQHRYVADMGNWLRDLKDITPKTWNQLDQIPFEGPFVLKGETNSKKFNWKTHMFAENKTEAIDVYLKLQEDGLIGNQSIYIRQYVPLVKVIDGVGDLPITKEFRFFIYNGVVLSGGFYWSNYLDDLDVIPDVNDVPKEFLQKIIDSVGKNIMFWVVDVAQTQSGDWIVIELNDAQQSGLSCNDPANLYSNLNKILKVENN
jgi:hypothetical protein